jgi:hypothetical protein
MENCYNHPERKAFSVCHSCGKYFCEECLTAGAAYYYCKSSVCQKKLEEENLRKRIICPNCFSVLEISRDEFCSSRLRCPECDSFIILVNSRSEKVEGKKYTKLLASSNQGDIAIMKSLLDNAEVDYYSAGENLVGVSPMTPAIFYVNETDIEVAKEILKDFELHLFRYSINNEEES